MKVADVDVLVAAPVASHLHHPRAVAWLQANTRFATCPLTELGLIRVLMQLGATPSDADLALDYIVRVHRAQLIPADLSATAIGGLSLGHRQTTDLYLVELARAHQATLSTFDRALCARFPQVTELVA